MTYVLGTATLAAAVWVIGAFMGAVHPLGDSLAVFVVPVAVCGMIGVALNWRWRLGRLMALVFAPVLVARVVLGIEAAPLEDVTYRLYQKNMLFHDVNRSDLIRDIQQSGADFVTLQEVSQANRAMLLALEPEYPHQHLCSGLRVGGVAILSKHPLDAQPCADVFGVAEAWADTPSGRVRIVAIHLRWPYPHRQAGHVRRILAALSPPDGSPTLLAGDFNMVPWAHSVRRLAQATDTRWLSRIERTFSLWNVPFFIDHVLAGPRAAVRIEVRPRLGSDHYGVLAQIAL